MIPCGYIAVKILIKKNNLTEKTVCTLFFIFLMEAHDIRVVIHFLWKQKHPNKQITQTINDVYGQGTVSMRTVQRWVERFAGGEESFEDKPRSGRPPMDDIIPDVQQILDDEPFKSQKKIARILNVHHSVIHRILTDVMGLTRVNFRWIPHRLEEHQKLNRVELSKSILHFLENATTQQLSMVITGDETWVYFSNPRSFMWMDSSVERPERPKNTIGAKKSMITVFWSISGMHLIRMLPPGERFTKEYFIEEVMTPLYNIICNKRPKKKTNGHFLHFDNAAPHRVDEIIIEMGFTRLPHPAYSPDLAPTDFFLFGYMKNLLEGKEFETPDHLFSEVSKILMSIPKSMLQDAYYEWIKRLRRCIEREGEYIH